LALRGVRGHVREPERDAREALKNVPAVLCKKCL
jgi:hypothetical protein